MLRFQARWTVHPERMNGARPNDWRNTKKAIAHALENIRQVWEGATWGYPIGHSRAILNAQYKNSLAKGQCMQIPDGPELSGAVVSTYKYATNIEEGYPAFDMKPGALNGPKVHIGKHGASRYAIIPFRWATPATQANSGAFTNQMDEPLYHAARRQQANQGGLSEAQLHAIDQKHGTAWAVPETSFTGYQWLRPQAGSLRKELQPRHTNYRSYRTISENSDPKSWWHPAMPANPIVESTTEFTEPDTARIVAEGVERDLQSIFS